MYIERRPVGRPGSSAMESSEDKNNTDDDKSQEHYTAEGADGDSHGVVDCVLIAETIIYS
ncbi:hypothetical protein DPMN_112618 [Dreissena polymorpha]|uniref:Uncharacterized protein n=1 Tax=Dreissena polymorpha TaxID=45954 RepID=A0A9D4KGP3_DREPO|nr:hypothetical protein DPMN_112618 [Dreissena polymorpha]